MSLSIILPVYNVEKYLERCFMSIFSQEAYLNNIEVVVVDDCSLDRSIEIAELWRRKHSNIRICSHEINRGLGAARNTGIRHATHDYIWFIDTDDYISCNSFSIIFDQIEASKPDVLKFNFTKESIAKEMINESPNPQYPVLNVTGFEFLKAYYQPATMSSCSNIYRRQYMLENKLFFTEGVYWEDADLVLDSYLKSQNFCYIPEYLYYYCYNESSISRSNNPKKIIDMLKMAIRKYNIAISITDQNLKMLVISDVMWNFNVLKKVFYLKYSDLVIFFNFLDNLDFKNVNYSASNFVIRFVLINNFFTRMTIYAISPLIIFLKRLINEVRTSIRRFR